MPVRMTGMISNMDTESLIKGMMDAQRIKNKKVTDKQTLLTWKQDKWKELNAKLYKLYKEDLSKMRLQGNYLTKAVTSSNQDLVTATGTPNTPEGSHNITIETLASPQYVTGMKLDKTEADGDAISGSSKLVSDLNMTDGTQIVIETANGKKVLDVDASTTIDMFLQKCKDAGLSANYDTVQKRFFISSKSSGLENQFSITTHTDAALTDKRSIDALVNYGGLSSTDKAKVEAAYQTFKGADSTKLAAAFASTDILETDDADTKAIKTAVKTLQDLTKTYTTKLALSVATSEVKDKMTAAIKNGETYLEVSYAGIYEADQKKAIEELRTKYQDFSEEKYQKELNALVDSKVAARVNGGIATADAKAVIESRQSDILANGATYTTTNSEGNSTTITVPSLTNAASSLKTHIEKYSAGETTTFTGELSKVGLTDLAIENGKVTAADANVKLVSATDSKITYNGVTFENSSNVISVNGLTLTLKGLSEGKTISLAVKNDAQKTYDMVKKFISSYNDILKEMNTLYNATSAKGYAPLSDDEKEAMTDDQIKKWEDKIKDSILRRDSTLGSVIDAMRNSLNTSVEVDGKRYSLASYGIQTSSDYTEKGLLHIYGDKDDAVYSDQEDKLMKALESDPDTVMEVLSGISKNLYDAMNKKMSSIPNVRSAYTFYNDKLMATQQTEYSKKVATLEKKLTAMENKYYKQFAAMETALSKLQSQTNALASMMGTSR